MKLEAWLDHLPPWMAWGAIAATGAYAPLELAFMAAPLLLAAWAQAAAWSLQRWRRLIEAATLAGFLAHVLARSGLLPTVVHTLFLLCGARLCLPRELPQRRQILLMGFLLFLTTAITTAELDFLLWSLVWVAGTALVLLQQNWTGPGPARPGQGQPPPFRLVLPWTALVVILAAGFFVILPRIRLGFRGLPGGTPGIKGSQAGISEILDLDKQGPIQDNPEVVLRVVPAPALTAAARADFGAAAALLRCFVLEDLQGQRWQVSDRTQPRAGVRLAGFMGGERPLVAEFFLEPGLRRTLPLPYGELDLVAGPGDELRRARGAAVGFAWPTTPRTTPFQIGLKPSDLQREPAPSGARLALLTHPGLNTGSALRWSLRTAPGELPAQALAERLSEGLRSFRYTLDNPSGGAANPLADFLERTRAGHCEYFASALAVMLRHRGVPSRVASGYRLGPWSREGNYFRVTQSEAHSWVEYYDAAAGGWRLADPTPAAPPSTLEAGTFGAWATRWSDALRFAWDRHVVQFSDQTQIAGLTWFQAQSQRLALGRIPSPSPRVLAGAGAGAGALALVGWALVRAWRRRPGPAGKPKSAVIRELAPLVRQVRRTLPPLPGETARAWLLRLAQARPDRAAPLARLAEAADAAAYGPPGPGPLKALAQQEARAWAARSAPPYQDRPRDPKMKHG